MNGATVNALIQGTFPNASVWTSIYFQDLKTQAKIQ